MLLEIQVIGSNEWYDQVIPALEKMGFKEIPEMFWADPETDGELRGVYYEYHKKEPLPLKKFNDFIAEIEQIIEEGEVPYIKFALVPDNIRE